MICGVKNSLHIIIIWCQPVCTAMELDGEIGEKIWSEINMSDLWTHTHHTHTHTVGQHIISFFQKCVFRQQLVLEQVQKGNISVNIYILG